MIGRLVDWIDDLDNGYYNGELPVVALLDIRLPGDIQGLDVGARLRQSPILSHDIRIVLVTAYKMSPREEKEALRRAGANLLIYKPIPRFNDFRKMIDKVLQ